MIDSPRALRDSIDRLASGELGVRDFCAQVRDGAAGWLAGLPPRFGDVLHDLLDRLESSALFTEESCSFSQTDLLDSLRLLADKAQARLAAGERSAANGA